MIKKSLFYITLLGLVAFVSFSFKPSEIIEAASFKVADNEDLHFLFPSNKPDDYIKLDIPYTGKFFIAFKEAVGFKESQGKYHKVNSLGYMGKYQFGAETLKTVGIHDSTRFLNSPKVQEKAFVALMSQNKWELKNEIKHYSGKTIAGVKVTESGILAAAHLGGAGSVKRFLKSKGSKKRTDAYGTSIKSYMKKFGGYDTSGIVARKNAKVRV